MPQPKLQFLFSLLVYTLVVRLLPYVLMNCDIKTDPTVLYYPWNFSPLTAVCLFGGAFLADRRLSFLIPLATLFISDLGILAITGRMEWAFPAGRWAFTYISFSLAAALGLLLRHAKARGLRLRAVASGVAFEVVFFAVSNYLVWVTTKSAAEPMYANSLAGLYECYLVGLPFFGKSLLGTTAFTLMLFSPFGIRAATEDGNETTGQLAPVRVKS